MGLFTYTIGGSGIVLIGASELLFSTPKPPTNSPPQSSQPLLFSSIFTYSSVFILSILFILDSLLSVFDAMAAKDHMGYILQFEVISIAMLFLLYSIVGFVSVVNKDSAFKLDSSIMNMLCLFAFGEEFFLFYQQKKDPSGVENRYYDLFLVSISVCLVSTMLELKNPGNRLARCGRGIGLIQQGMWVVQMGFSFFSDLMSNGCYLDEKSRGNYTVRCKGHMEYHRGRAIATLLFNSHLALLVVLICVVYSFASKQNGMLRESTRYKPLGAEMQQFVNQGQFTLDSDDEEGHGSNGGIKEERNGEMKETALMVPDSIVNGHVSHQ